MNVEHLTWQDKNVLAVERGKAMINKSTIDKANAVSVLSIAEKESTLKGTGKWRTGPCPVCGGTDRFQVNVNDNVWLCRHCTESKYKGAIDLQMALNNQKFPQAVEALVGTICSTNTNGDEIRRAPPTKQREILRAPTGRWQEQAQLFVERGVECLWSCDGARALAWLRGNERNLTDETIRKWGLGYNPADSFVEYSDWDVDRSEGKLWLPRGIIVPCFIGGRLWRVKVRRASGQPKMPFIAGSVALALFNADGVWGKDIVMMVEGEWDAMIVDQAAGDLVAACTIGAQGYPLDPTWMPYLMDAKHILEAYDTDGKSDGGSAKLNALSKRIKHVTVPAKDPTDYAKRGGDLRAWVQEQLAHIAQPNTPQWLVAALAECGLKLQSSGDHLLAVCPDAENEFSAAWDAWYAKPDDDDLKLRVHIASHRIGAPLEIEL